MLVNSPLRIWLNREFDLESFEDRNCFFRPLLHALNVPGVENEIAQTVVGHHQHTQRIIARFQQSPQILLLSLQIVTLFRRRKPVGTWIPQMHRDNQMMVILGQWRETAIRIRNPHNHGETIPLPLSQTPAVGSDRRPELSRLF